MKILPAARAAKHYGPLLACAEGAPVRVAALAIVAALVLAAQSVHAQASAPRAVASAPAKPQARAARPGEIAHGGVPAAQLDWSSGILLDPPKPAPVVESVKPPRQLGPIDSWRFRRCQESAAQAPTVLGVRVALQLCREQFGQ